MCVCIQYTLGHVAGNVRQGGEGVEHWSHVCGPHPTIKFLLGDAEQPGLVSHQPGRAGAERSVTIQATFLMTLICRKEAIEQPDTMADQLQQAGDIETNPGPGTDQRSRPTRRTVAPAAIIPERRTGSRDVSRATRARNADQPNDQPDPDRCRECEMRFSAAIRPFECKECKGRYHQNHTGETRSAREKILKYKREWTCPHCRLGTTALMRHQGHK